MSDPGRLGNARPLAGIGLKQQHVPELLGSAVALDFVEIHAENYMVEGGPRLRQLEAVRDRFELSVHGVGLSIGGPGPLDRDHLHRLATLVRRFEPTWCSEHLAWSGHGGHWFGDLLPLPYDQETLDRVCAHVHQVQEALGRHLLLENPSTYVEFAASSFEEGHILAELVRRTGCGLLLDVNNAFVSAVNHGRDPWTLVAALPPDAVGEIHLAGFSEDQDALGAPLLVDDHGSAVDEAVWTLFERTVAHLGPRPTLLERDHDVPPLAALTSEAERARRLLARAQEAA